MVCASVQAGGLVVRQTGLPDVPGSLSKTTVARGIDSSGNMSGYATTPGSNGLSGSVGFFWSQATASYTILNLGSYGYTSAFGINDAGVVVGDYALTALPTNQFAGFIYDSSTGLVTTNDQIRYRGISNAGDLTGITIFQPDGSILGYRNYRGEEETFSCFGAIYTNGEGINTAGDVVGTYTLASGFQGAFLYHDGQCIDLSIPGATFSAAWAINDRGDIVGEYVKSKKFVDVLHGGFYRHDGKLDLSILPYGYSGTRPRTYALSSINNERVVVGSAAPADSASFYGPIYSFGDGP